MAKPLLVANWKNYPNSLDEAKSLLGKLSKGKKSFKKVSLFIAPPLPYLESVSLKARNFAGLACQDIAEAPTGTYTGIVTPEILKSLGVKLVILGHSERRALGETDEEVARKAKKVLRAGMVPLICVGEKTRDHEGHHFEFLREEIKASLSGLHSRGLKFVIAYEPIWAIGTKALGAIEPADLAESVIFIKKILSDLFGRKTADRIPILYGGSVDSANAGKLFAQTGIRGYLVGRASLNAKTFSDIAKAIFSK
ncbi:MAG: triose-phosphate isomerase family protein [Minisyncoccia bacterium]